MDFIETELQGAFLIKPKILKDERGGFTRVFCKQDFKQIGHSKDFVQFNHSFNINRGTLRGMHYQESPHSEIKLIRCIRGSVFDVIIDIRKSSPTFLKWHGTVLSEENKDMIYVPEGFAHGFITLEENSELLYHHTSFYEPKSERGIRYDDSIINIEWPEAIISISDKDRNYPLLTTNFKGI